MLLEVPGWGGGNQARSACQDLAPGYVWGGFSHPTLTHPHIHHPFLLYPERCGCAGRRRGWGGAGGKQQCRFGGTGARMQL